MEDEKDKKGKTDDCQHNRTDDDRNCGINSSFLADEINNKIDGCRSDRAHDSSQKQYKESIVSFSDAIIDKGTVMVKYRYAVAAGRAMAGSGRTIDFAS